MHKIVETKLFPQIFDDRRLHSTAALLRIRLHYARIDTAAGHRRGSPLSKETMRRAIRRLVDCEWVFEHPQRDRRTPLIVPWMPPDVERIIVYELERVRSEVAFSGEWLMKSILYLAVDDQDYRDNARLRWLSLGDGGGILEVDRWHREEKVAIEFHGTQHYEYVPKLHKTKQAFIAQQMRDNVKAGLCMRQGVEYVEFSAEDLSFHGVVNKIRGLLPLRPVPMDSPIVRTLDSMCSIYVNTVRRASRRSTR